MNFQVRKPQGLNSDRVDDVELVFIQNEQHSQVTVMTWKELTSLMNVLRESVLGHEYDENGGPSDYSEDEDELTDREHAALDE